MERLLFLFCFQFFFVIFFSRGQGGGRAKGRRGCRKGDGGGLLRCPASSFYLLYWYKSTNTDAEAGLLRCPASSFYLLYWYKRANTDAEAGGAEHFLAKDPNGLITDESVQVVWFFCFPFFFIRTLMPSSLWKASRYFFFGYFFFFGGIVSLQGILSRGRIVSLQGILSRGLKIMVLWGLKAYFDEALRQTTIRPSTTRP
jgi:hypothetical protein